MRHQTLRHHVKAALCVLGGVWVLVAGCSPATQLTQPLSQPTPADLLWGAPNSLGQAESLAAPAIAVNDGTTMFVWAGADQKESRLYAQSSTASAPTILALKVTTPLDVTLAPASEGFFHLLWRDDVDGKPHLFYSLFNKDAVAVLDAYDLSEQPVYNFAVQPTEDGSLHVVYSAGWVAEPRLFVHDIDGKGRAQFPVALDQAGDFPSLFQYGPITWLFWQTEDGAVWDGQLIDTTLVNPASVVESPPLSPGDQIAHMSVSAHTNYGYLFWQIVRADGTPEAWYAVGEIPAEQRWSPAMRLTIPTLGDTVIDIGYHAGQVTAAERGADPVGWGMMLNDPATFTYNVVPIAVQTGNVLGIAYLNAGNIIGYQRLTRVAQMIGSPMLAAKLDASLVVSWAEVGTNAAQLSWLQSMP